MPSIKDGTPIKTMTGEQAELLKTLTEQLTLPEMFDDRLSREEAEIRINELREKVGSQTKGNCHDSTPAAKLPKREPCC